MPAALLVVRRAGGICLDADDRLPEIADERWVDRDDITLSFAFRGNVVVHLVEWEDPYDAPAYLPRHVVFGSPHRLRPGPSTDAFLQAAELWCRRRGILDPVTRIGTVHCPLIRRFCDEPPPPGRLRDLEARMRAATLRVLPPPRRPPPPRRAPREYARADPAELCSICLRPATDRVLDACGHPFHEGCIDRWAAVGGVTCPYCRRGGGVEVFRVS
jgi:hypothetical protein